MILSALLLAASQAPIDFETDVQPILEEHCVGCHGPKRQKAGLRLDRRAAAFAGSAFGERAVIVPGSSAESELFQRVATDDEDERMPAGDDALAPELVETLRIWIDSGAVWPDGGESAQDGGVDKHWAYVAPTPPELPQLSEALDGWSQSPLDAFIASALAERGLAPAPEAPRSALVRRVTLDLTGLPPTPQQVQEFVDDPRADAWERLIERLLASPHYAEHQARFWLDLARYADSHGYEKDARRTMWRYRDWVIDAFERDLPFDRFTIEQIAGDLLPGATPDQRIATGFHRNTMVNQEGGIDPEEFRVAAVVDRVDTTGSVWLGSTIGCARCHDHKYDPIRQSEYYQLFAFFNSTEDGGGSDAPTIEAPTPELALEREAGLAAIAAAEERYQSWTPELEDALAAWLDARAASPVAWTLLRPTGTVADEGTRLAVLDDSSVLAFGEEPASDTYRLRVPLGGMRAVTGLRLRVRTDPSLPGGGPGRPGHANFVLNEVTVALTSPGSPGSRPLALAAALADYEQDGFGAAQAIDADRATGWAIAGGTGADHELWLLFAAPLDASAEPAGAELSIELAQLYGSGHLIGRFDLAATSDPLEAAGALLPRDLAQALAAAASSRAPDAEAAADPTAPAPSAWAALPSDLQARLRDWFRAWTPELESLRTELARLRSELPAAPTALVMRELAEPRATHVLERGSFLAPAQRVEAGVPLVLHDLDLAGGETPGARAPNRLDLARWLVAADNPLTARVFVNRLWARLFGTGLVATENDFGLQSEPPSRQSGVQRQSLSSGFRRRGGAGSRRKVTDAVLRTLMPPPRHRPLRCLLVPLMAILSSAPAHALAPPVTTSGEHDFAAIRRTTEARKVREAAIRAEVETLGDSHPWAGTYYYGDGLGFNATLWAAPKAGFAFCVRGCGGPWEQNYGTVEFDGERLRLLPQLEPDRGGVRTFSAELYLVPWGERRYLIPVDDMEWFCQIARRAEYEPRATSHGWNLLRRDDPLKPAAGRPSVPAAFEGLLNGEAPPVRPPFSDLSLEDALWAARQQNRLLVAHVFTLGELPFKPTPTWEHERVSAWISAHAVAIQIDAERQPQLARSLAVRRFPETVVIHPTGRVLGRQRGHRSVEAQIEFLEDALWLHKTRELQSPAEALALVQSESLDLWDISEAVSDDQVLSCIIATLAAGGSLYAPQRINERRWRTPVPLLSDDRTYLDDVRIIKILGTTSARYRDKQRQMFHIESTVEGEGERVVDSDELLSNLAWLRGQRFLASRNLVRGSTDD